MAEQLGLAAGGIIIGAGGESPGGFFFLERWMGVTLGRAEKGAEAGMEGRGRRVAWSRLVRR